MQLIHCNDLSIYYHDSKYGLKENETYGQRETTCYELDYILFSENGQIITNGLCHSLKPGMLFYRTPGMIVEGTAHYTSWYVKYSTDNILEPLSSISFFPLSHVINDLFKNIYDIYIKNATDASYLYDLNINQILYHLYNDTIHGVHDVSHNIKLEQIKKKIESNWNKNLSLDSIVSMSGYSKSRFCHLFKELYQISPIIYLRNLRMQYACRALIETNLPIKEVMLNSGYTNEQTFFRYFKKFTGVTPMNYRLAHRFNSN